MNFTEDQLSAMARPPSESEEDRCRNAVNRITEAVRGRFGNDVSIFLQGSYKNRTNVRKDSDVDIIVRHDSYYFYDIGSLSPEEKQIYEANRNPAQYTFSQFKNDIQSLLEKEFDEDEVERKNKCVRVKGSSYRVNADVVPCYEYHRFGSPTHVEAIGIGLLPDEGPRIHSFPIQHYDKGVAKNKSSNGGYKDIVRILKRARNDLIEKGILTKDSMPSFFLECLVWNLHDLHFQHSNYGDMVSAVIAKVWRDMDDFSMHNDYAEVSDLKWLFRGEKVWTPQQAKDFMGYSWSYFGF